MMTNITDMFKGLSFKEWVLLIVTTIIVAAFFFLHQLHGVAAFFAKPADCTGVDGQTHEITMLDTTFAPDLLHATVCDTIVITNKSTVLHEPAVGPHPTHNTYPDFDAKRPLQKDEGFSLHLKQTGTYQFHDHLNEKMVGKITIHR